VSRMTFAHAVAEEQRDLDAAKKRCAAGKPPLKVKPTTPDPNRCTGDELLKALARGEECTKKD
jgi:hypothetical protein